MTSPVKESAPIRIGVYAPEMPGETERREVAAYEVVGTGPDGFELHEENAAVVTDEEKRFVYDIGSKLVPTGYSLEDCQFTIGSATQKFSRAELKAALPEKPAPSRWTFSILTRQGGGELLSHRGYQGDAAARASYALTDNLFAAVEGSLGGTSALSGEGESQINPAFRTGARLLAGVHLVNDFDLALSVYGIGGIHYASVNSPECAASNTDEQNSAIQGTRGGQASTAGSCGILVDGALNHREGSLTGFELGGGVQALLSNSIFLGLEVTARNASASVNSLDPGASKISLSSGLEPAVQGVIGFTFGEGARPDRPSRSAIGTQSTAPLRETAEQRSARIKAEAEKEAAAKAAEAEKEKAAAAAEAAKKKKKPDAAEGKKEDKKKAKTAPSVDDMELATSEPKAALPKKSPDSHPDFAMYKNNLPQVKCEDKTCQVRLKSMVVMEKRAEVIALLQQMQLTVEDKESAISAKGTTTPKQGLGGQAAAVNIDYTFSAVTEKDADYSPLHWMDLNITLPRTEALTDAEKAAFELDLKALTDALRKAIQQASGYKNY